MEFSSWAFLAWSLADSTNAKGRWLRLMKKVTCHSLPQLVAEQDYTSALCKLLLLRSVQSDFKTFHCRTVSLALDSTSQIHATVSSWRRGYVCSSLRHLCRSRR